MTISSLPAASRSRWYRALVVAICLIAGLLLPVQAESPHLRLGNPSRATTDTQARDNFLMEKPYFALSYNSSKGTPNWVSWRLTNADLGKAPRQSFYPDETLPEGFTRVTPRDYTGSGFDRGHLCPHSDRDATVEMSRATFVMTNMIPQAPHVNQQAWEKLEAYCRELVTQHGKSLYIIAGPWGQGGTGSRGPEGTIGTAHPVTVPAQCWKVIMVLDAAAGEAAAPVAGPLRLIAVLMPNDQRVGEEWTGYRVSVKKIEELTGYTFFDRVPAEVIAPLKAAPDQEVILTSEPNSRDQ